MVVEDDREISDTIVEFLRMEGWTVERAFSGEEGLSLAQKFLPCVVVTETRLRGIADEGLEMLSALRETDHCKDVRAFVFSFYESDALKRRAAALHVEAYLDKCREISKLMQLVGKPKSTDSP
jgi:CheY-like chemotaxis protein